MNPWMEEKYRPLVGAKIVDVSGPHHGEDWELCITLEFPDGKKAWLIPWRDPEGNGPGYLEVHREEEE